MKYLKIKKSIHENITADNDVVPENFNELKAVAIDTMNWRIGFEVQKNNGGDHSKIDAAQSKTSVLLAKLINTFNPDTSSLTELEQAAFDKLIYQADAGYADSELLNNSLTVLNEKITIYTERIARIVVAADRDEILSILTEV